MSKWSRRHFKRRKNGSKFLVEGEAGEVLGYGKVVKLKGMLYLNIYTLEDEAVGSYKDYASARKALLLARGDSLHDDGAQVRVASPPPRKSTASVEMELHLVRPARFSSEESIVEERPPQDCTQNLQGPQSGDLQVGGTASGQPLSNQQNPYLAGPPPEAYLYQEAVEGSGPLKSNGRTQQSNTPRGRGKA